MVNLLEIPQVIFFFFNDIIDLLRLFQKRSFVLSSKHENQNVATIGTYTVRSIHVKLSIRTSCHLFTVSATYLIEIRREA